TRADVAGPRRVGDPSVPRPRPIEERPEGFVYRPGLLTAAEERDLLVELDRLEFHEIRMHGVVAKRSARHYGLDYDYTSRTPVAAAEAVPGWLLPVRAAAGELAAVEPDALAA